jgi:hypothetical protein
MRRAEKVTVILALAAAAVFVVTGFSNAAGGGGGPTLCPDIYAPVICSNGKVYPNQCYANKAHAKNCVPYGEI